MDSVIAFVRSYNVLLYSEEHHVLDCDSSQLEECILKLNLRHCEELGYLLSNLRAHSMPLEVSLSIQLPIRVVHILSESPCVF